MRVWITRTRPGADRTATRLREAGLDPLIDPVLEVRPLGGAINLAGIDALAFTSPNAVQFFAGSCTERRLVAYAVGTATRDALIEAGFETVQTAQGDVVALAEQLGRDQPGRLLHPAAAEPAADLAALCAPFGVEVQVQAIYDAVAVRPKAALEADDLVAVMAHSPRAAAELAKVASDRLSNLIVAALSPACAAPLQQSAARRIVIAPFPDDASLVRLTVQALSEARA